MSGTHIPHNTATPGAGRRYARGLCCTLWIFAVCSVALAQTTPASPDEIGYLEYSVQRSLEPARNIHSMSADGRYVLSSSLWAELTLWDVSSGEVVGLYHGHNTSDFGQGAVAMGIGSGNAVVIGDLIVSQAMSQGFFYDHGLQLYNPATQETQRENAGSSCFDMLALQERMVVACDAQLELWAIEDGRLVQQAVQPRPSPSVPDPFLVADPSTGGFALVEPSYQSPDEPVVVSFWGLEPLQQQAVLEGDAAHIGSEVRITPGGDFASLAPNYDQDRLELLLTPRNLGQPERIPLALSASGLSATPAISPDAAYVVADFVLSFAEQPSANASLFDIAARRYLVTGMEPLFAETYSWLWPSPDHVLWSGFTSTFPLPQLTIWRSGDADDLSASSSYPLMVDTTGAWENLLTRNNLDNIGALFGSDFGAPEQARLYHPDPEVLLSELLRPLTEEVRAELGPDVLDIRLFGSDGDVMRAEAEFPVLDDSVLALRYAFSLRRLPLRSGPVWAVQEAYRQQQCGRGDLANQWVDGVGTLCP